MSARHKKEIRARLRKLRATHHNLAREHGEVKERVNEYMRRRYLTPGEELEVKTLQRMKLYKKDALARIQKELADLERSLNAAPERTS